MRRSSGLPAGTLLAFCGDDFTGSSAVMEVMTFAGLPAVMFVEVPTAEQLIRFRRLPRGRRRYHRPRTTAEVDGCSFA